MFALREHQLEALKHMKNGCILCGGTGSGKTLTSLAYYYLKFGGTMDFLTGGDYEPMDDYNMKPLYIITTPRKRDLHEWDSDMKFFLLSTNPDICIYRVPVIVDSWNNIKKYRDITNAFFIFDEDKVTGSGAWVKSFLKIAKHNEWIILSATPGDNYSDYAAVFIANGFFRNMTEFKREHIVYKPYMSYPVIDRYIGTQRLDRLRRSILVPMNFNRTTIQHHENVFCMWDQVSYRRIMKDRWNIYDDCPIENASELCYLLRKLVNSDYDRQVRLLEICESHKRVIIFYNFDYELEILKSIAYFPGTEVAEWNGHAHQPIPNSERWVYLVQYTAGAEGWNCITTDTIVFYSQNYSYKVLEQSIGRIDRLNTPFRDLYYYHLKSRASIDLGIARRLQDKKKFNESAWVGPNAFPKVA